MRAFVRVRVREETRERGVRRRDLLSLLLLLLLLMMMISARAQR